MNLLDILYGTPWWVWVILVYLLIIGFKSLKTTPISLERFIIIPIIFTAWGFYSFLGKYNLWCIIGWWLCAIVIGVFIGKTFLSYNIHVDKQTKNIQLKGSYFPLLLYLSFFLLKYFISVSYAIAPQMKSNSIFWMTDVIASGIILGILFGRLFFVLLKIHKK